MSDIIPVILCGGSGTRLWPRSRAVKPKPFLPLVGEATLFEATVLRCADSADFAPPVVVTGTAHLAHVEAQLPVGERLLVPYGISDSAVGFATTSISDLLALMV